MKIGLMFANGAAASEPGHAAELAVEAESLGFESLWAVRHVVAPVRYDSRDPYPRKGSIPGGDDDRVASLLGQARAAATATR